MSTECWTPALCAEAMSNATSRVHAAKLAPAAYRVACQMGWRETIFDNLGLKNGTPRGRPVLFSFDSAMAAAKKCATLAEFRVTYPDEYNFAKKQKFVSRVISESGLRRAVRADLSTNEIRDAFRVGSYSSRTDLRERSFWLYKAIHNHGLSDELLDALPRRHTILFRHVYLVVSRKGRAAYVGLTHDVGQRLRGHRMSGRASVRALLQSPHRVFTSRLMSAEQAARSEDAIIKRLREKGYSVLNAARGGHLGWSKTRWTTQTIENAAHEYAGMGWKEFETQYPGAARKCFDLHIASHIQAIVRRNAR